VSTGDVWRIELKIDKGRDHGLVADLRFGVYEVHNPKPLCDVSLKYHGDPKSNAPEVPIATLETKCIRIVLPVDQNWNLSMEDLTSKSFRIHPLMPPSVPVISELLSACMYEIDHEWSLGDIRLGGGLSSIV